jgi:hypothetical protein
MTKLREELLKEIKDLKETLGQSITTGESGPLYSDKPASYWLRRLKDTNPTYRAEALEALGALALKNKPLIPVLVSALNDTDKTNTVVPIAREALAVVGEDAVPMLVGVVGKKSSRFARQNAVVVLSMLRSKAKAAVPVLVELLQENDEALQTNAIYALREIGPDAKPAVPALVKILGPSIKAFKAEHENEIWWKDGVNGGQLSMALPSQIYEALLRIDPGIIKLLPSNPLRAGTTWDAQVSIWQKAYETLKKEYGEQ